VASDQHIPQALIPSLVRDIWPAVYSDILTITSIVHGHAHPGALAHLTLLAVPVASITEVRGDTPDPIFENWLTLVRQS